MTAPAFAQRRPLLLSAIFMFLIILVAGSTGIYVLSDENLSDNFKMIRVAVAINRLYQHEVDWDQLMRAGMDGMFERLDRYSGYVDPRRWNRMHEEFSGSYTGIGVSVLQHDEGLLIMSVREDGPAAGGGIMSGDIIIGIDSVSLRGRDVFEATDILRGPEGTEVDLRVYRSVDNDTLNIRVERRKIDFVHIPFAGFTPDSLIYVRLLDFDAGASHDLETALDSLLEKADFEPYGVILDLRGNPGGLFSEAYRTANLFLDDGQFIVGTDGRSRWSNEEHYADGSDITDGLPLAVIVDGGSASSSEIVAGSLHQLERAVLIGDTTFGKGLVQGFNRLHDGSAVRLTISRYYLEDNLYLNEFDSALVDIGHGLVPDHLISFSEHAAFPRALERSLLPNRFANQHQDEIVAASEQFELSDEWVNRFERFALDNGFEFTSSTTEQATDLTELADRDDLGRATRRAIDRILEQSLRDDANQFVRHQAYIKRRLKQIAYERKSGTYMAYANAIVPSRPDIQMAARILRASK